MVQMIGEGWLKRKVRKVVHQGTQRSRPADSADCLTTFAVSVFVPHL